MYSPEVFGHASAGHQFWPGCLKGIQLRDRLNCYGDGVADLMRFAPEQRRISPRNTTATRALRIVYPGVTQLRLSPHCTNKNHVAA